MRCLMAATKGGDFMQIDEAKWTEEEREALGHASDAGGQYAQSLGRTDFREWSPDEWQMMVNHIALAFTERLRELSTSEDVPF
jgi:hypothetical protein